MIQDQNLVHMIKKIQGSFFEKLELYHFPFDIQVCLRSFVTECHNYSYLKLILRVITIVISAHLFALVKVIVIPLLCV